MRHDADDEILLGEERGGQEQKDDETKQTAPERTVAPNSFDIRRWRPGTVPLRAHIVAGALSPHRDRMMTAMNRNYLEKLELGKR